MRKLSEVLAAARAHIAGGWSPIVSRDAAGEICTPDDEGVTSFSILDALDVVTAGDWVELQAACRALGRRLTRYQPPEWELARDVKPVSGLLGDWEADPRRTQADVLQLLARARLNALAQESR